MAGNDKNKNSTDQSAAFKDLIDLQKDQLSFDREKLDFQKQHIQNQADLAKQSLIIQKDLLQSAPTERRKDRKQIFQYGGGFFLLILGFCGFCLFYGYESFLRYFVGAITHLTTLGIGYYFGTRIYSKDIQSESPYEEAEIMDN